MSSQRSKRGKTEETCDNFRINGTMNVPISDYRFQAISFEFEIFKLYFNKQAKKLLDGKKA